MTILVISGCRKKEDPEFDISSAKDHARCQNIALDMLRMGLVIARDLESPNLGELQCADSLSITTSTDPVQAQVYFPENNCNDGEDVFRRGNLLVLVSGDITEAGSSLVIATDDYALNDFEATGQVRFTNLGEASNGNDIFSFSTGNFAVNAPGNDYVLTYAPSYQMEWIDGENSNFVVDDIYKISGSSSGVYRADETYETNITSSLIYQYTCHWITSGRTDITPQSGAKRTINFGSGNCENKASVTGGSGSGDFNM